MDDKISSIRTNINVDKKMTTINNFTNREQQEQKQQDTKLTADVLSRSVIYTPFRAYEQNNIEPSEYVKQFRNIPKSIQDPAVIDFYNDISIHYHENRTGRAIGLDGKNTSGKPLSRDYITKNLSSRAITLIGEYYSNSRDNKKNTTERTTPNESIASRHNVPNLGKDGGVVSIQRLLLQQELRRNRNINNKKKRKMNSLVEAKDIETKPRSHHKKDSDPQIQKINIDFLMNMNQKWNDYAWSIISLHANSKSANSTSREEDTQDIALSIRLHQFSEDDIEWVGARVKIRECHSRIGFEGKEGILIASTAETWRICEFVEPKNPNNKSSTSSANKYPPKTLKTLVVPKKKTTLIVRLPVQSKRDENVKQEVRLDDSDLVSAKKCLCFVLTNPSG